MFVEKGQIQTAVLFNFPNVKIRRSRYSLRMGAMGRVQWWPCVLPVSQFSVEQQPYFFGTAILIRSLIKEWGVQWLCQKVSNRPGILSKPNTLMSQNWETEEILNPYVEETWCVFRLDSGYNIIAAFQISFSFIHQMLWPTEAHFLSPFMEEFVGRCTRAG